MRCLTFFVSIVIVCASGKAGLAWPLALRGSASTVELPSNVEMARWRHRYRSNEDSDKMRGLWRSGDDTVGMGSLLQPFIPDMRREGRRRSRWVDPPPPE
jgi:hypothetical protein